MDRTVGREGSSRTRKVVIKQGFDDVRSKIDVDTVVLLAARHFSIQIVNECAQS